MAVQGPLSFSVREEARDTAFARSRSPHIKSDGYSGSHPPEVLERRLSDFLTKLQSYQKSWEGEGHKRQCPGLRDQNWLGDQDSMSQRPSASRPASRSSAAEGQSFTLPPVHQLRDDVQDGRPQFGRPGTPLEHAGQSPAARQLPTVSAQGQRITSFGQPAAGGDLPAPSRPGGLHSLLNPAHPEMSSPRSVSGGLPQARASSMQYGPSRISSGSPAMSGQSGLVPSPTNSQSGTLYPPRRILTPRSPRAASLGRGLATIDAQRAPFLNSGASGRVYTADPTQTPTSDVPPMPTPPSHIQQSYNYPAQPTQTPSASDRRSIGQVPIKTPLSQSASPSTSVSSFGPQGQTSPHFQQGQGQSATSYFPPTSYPGQMQMSHNPAQTAGSATTEGPYSPSVHASVSSLSHGGGEGHQVSSSGPGGAGGTSANYQIWTIKNDSGSYQIPVDVQAASKMADEKRARNAGASARFRQRRKEKEREANSNIQKLEQTNRELERKIREVEQERDFYRSERDRFRDVVYRTPGTRELAMQAPISPRLTRPPAPFPPTGPSYPAGEREREREPEPSDERAPRRRRTDTGDSTQGSYGHAPATFLPPAQTSAYGQAQAPSGLPPLRMDTMVQNSPGGMRSASMGTPATTTASSPYNPYQPREHGGWPSNIDNRGRGR